ncbi:C-type lectin domain family 4 member M [Fundulus heteroclitus]|uniref:C-type lectin domain family 4 member M n=1 Tax=Fundulus heteroclitus TaxID=8078 RepID=UPI00165C2462|nr:C-type lectin domain family 4 member M [Fundulus heteroclitus]
MNRLSSTDAPRANHNALNQNRKDILNGEDSRLRSQNVALSVEKQRLEVLLRNLTEHNQQLQQSYKSLTAERDKLVARLQTQRSPDAERARSESNCSLLRRETAQLQESLETLNKSKIQTETNYSLLWKNKELLQASFNDLRKENKDLQARCKNMTNSTDMFKTIDKMTEKRNELLCPTHWRVFEAKCYFVSTAKKNWTESRRACIAEGADLLIINSDEEQKFANGMLGKEQNAWIGLTDSLTEGVWTWVDGTPVTTTYWGTGQPNSHGGDQDCGELVQTELNGGWNDDGCFAQQLWICEK